MFNLGISFPPVTRSGSHCLSNRENNTTDAMQLPLQLSTAETDIGSISTTCKKERVSDFAKHNDVAKR